MGTKIKCKTYLHMSYRHKHSFRDKTFEEAVDLLTIEEEKLPRKTKLYTLIKSYSNTKLVQS
jgi:hypothetical protein